MAIITKLNNIIKYRDNIVSVIKQKGVSIPDNCKLKNIPVYISQLIKSDEESGGSEWSEDYFDSVVEETKTDLITAVSQWTGHVDKEGLKEIGWTDDDIEWFEQNGGIQWDEENDDDYLVSDYEKELYNTGAITTSNYNITQINASPDYIVEWRNNIKWMPKYTTEKLQTTINFRSFVNMIGCPAFDTSNTTIMSYLFANCGNLTCIPNLNFSKVVKLDYAFFSCSKIYKIPDITLAKCTTLEYAFADCYNLTYVQTLDCPIVTNLSNTFTNCTGLKTISGINTSTSLTTVNCMFAGCYALQTIPYIETSKVTNFYKFVAHSEYITTIPKLDTSSATNMSFMFWGCTSLLEIPEIDTAKVTNFASMFYGCPSLSKLPENFTFSSGCDCNNMFYQCISLTNFPYKLDYGTKRDGTVGVKNVSNMFGNCSQLSSFECGEWGAPGNSTNLFTGCFGMREVYFDDVCDKSSIPWVTSFYKVKTIGGQMKGINKSVSFAGPRNISRNAILNVLNAVEDVNDRIANGEYGTNTDGTNKSPTLTIGEIALRILSADDKLIATSKGWILK